MMKGTSKPSGKAQMKTLYDSEGNEVQVYRMVEEETGVGENYEYSQEQPDAQQQHGYSGSGRDWNPWADAQD